MFFFLSTFPNNCFRSFPLQQQTLHSSRQQQGINWERWGRIQQSYRPGFRNVADTQTCSWLCAKFKKYVYKQENPCVLLFFLFLFCFFKSLPIVVYFWRFDKYSCATFLTWLRNIATFKGWTAHLYSFSAAQAVFHRISLLLSQYRYSITTKVILFGGVRLFKGKLFCAIRIFWWHRIQQKVA